MPSVPCCAAGELSGKYMDFTFKLGAVDNASSCLSASGTEKMIDSGAHQLSY